MPSIFQSQSSRTYIFAGFHFLCKSFQRKKSILEKIFGWPRQKPSSGWEIKRQNLKVKVWRLWIEWAANKSLFFWLALSDLSACLLKPDDSLAAISLSYRASQPHWVSAPGWMNRKPGGLQAATLQPISGSQPGINPLFFSISVIYHMSCEVKALNIKYRIRSQVSVGWLLLFQAEVRSGLGLTEKCNRSSTTTERKWQERLKESQSG